MKHKHYNSPAKLSIIGLVCITILTVSAPADSFTGNARESGYWSTPQNAGAGNNDDGNGIMPLDDSSKRLDIEE